MKLSWHVTFVVCLRMGTLTLERSISLAPVASLSAFTRVDAGEFNERTQKNYASLELVI